MTSYLITAEIADLSGHKRSRFPRLEIVTSAPEKEINNWLDELGLPYWSYWQYDGGTASNAPGLHKGVFNTLYMRMTNTTMSTKNRVRGDERLVLSFHELVPVDPTTIL